MSIGSHVAPDPDRQPAAGPELECHQAAKYFRERQGSGRHAATANRTELVSVSITVGMTP